MVKYSLYYIEVVGCQYITFFILLQHSFNVIIGRSPRCISIIWSFIASQFFSGHFQITIMIECTVMAFYCDCNSSSSVKLTWLQTRSQRWMERGLWTTRRRLAIESHSFIASSFTKVPTNFLSIFFALKLLRRCIC